MWNQWCYNKESFFINNFFENELDTGNLLNISSHRFFIKIFSKILIFSLIGLGYTARIIRLVKTLGNPQGE